MVVSSARTYIICGRFYWHVGIGIRRLETRKSDAGCRNTDGLCDDAAGGYSDLVVCGIYPYFRSGGRTTASADALEENIGQNDA